MTAASASPSFVSLLSFLMLFTIVHATTINTKPTQLVDKVCKQTSTYSFCINSLYSDSHTPDADQYSLAFISVRLAYINATTTHHHISALLKNNNSSSHAYNYALQRCSRDYSKAVSALEMAYNDLNSETFFELADLGNRAARSANDCQAAFKGISSPPLATRNHDLIGLCEICAVVGKLFSGRLLF